MVGMLVVVMVLLLLVVKMLVVMIVMEECNCLLLQGQYGWVISCNVQFCVKSRYNVQF